MTECECASHVSVGARSASAYRRTVLSADDEKSAEREEQRVHTSLWWARRPASVATPRNASATDHTAMVLSAPHEKMCSSVASTHHTRASWAISVVTHAPSPEGGSARLHSLTE